jgi:hypothetical protein
MKAFAIAISNLILLGGVAVAQTNPGSPTTPQQPSQPSIPSREDTSHLTSGHSSADSTASMSAQHAAIKSCITRQQQANFGTSRADAKKAYMAQIKSSN